MLAEFARLGCECAVMSPPGFAIAATRFAAVRFGLPRHRGLALGLLAARFRLEQANRDWRPDLIVPLDDASAWLLRGLATSRWASVELRHLLDGAGAGADVGGGRGRPGGAVQPARDASECEPGDRDGARDNDHPLPAHVDSFLSWPRSSCR
jgi:hypothetical protein